MDAFDFLDLVIGLIFIFLIYSIAASALWEIFVNAAHLRGNMLCKWIMNNFKGLNYSDNERNKILDHPMISLFHYPIIEGNVGSWFKQLFSKSKKSGKSKRKPNYISSKVFTDVLVDLITHDPDAPLGSADVNINTFRNRLIQTKYLPDELKSVFLGYISDASGSLQKVKEEIGAWYEEAQDRLIGSYKKNLQMWIFLISAILVGSTNADTFNFISYLYNNDEARAEIATRASLFVQDSSIVNLISRIDTTSGDSAFQRDQKQIVAHLNKQVATLKTLNTELKENNIPIGWYHNIFDEQEKPKDPKLLMIWYLRKFLGLLITVLAVGLGSPFWFDILSKLSNLRSSGKKPETVDEGLKKEQKIKK